MNNCIQKTPISLSVSFGPVLARQHHELTSDITTTNHRGEILEEKTEAYIGEVWYTIARNTMTYNPQGKRITSENLAGQITTTAWDQFACTSVDELISAAKNAKSAEHACDSDDIGNRLTSSERGTNSVYAANQLNQYTAVDDFTPQFDDDGNQTLIKTATGIWSVTYNGENRPILRTCTQSNNQTITNQTIISMSYDRMGRRVTKNAQWFVYDGYLQIANFEHQTSNIKLQTFIWDPTEPIATRPLVWGQCEASAALNIEPSTLNFYTHDGNKNVSEVVVTADEIVAHYEYAPFGSLTASTRNSASTTYDFRADNHFRFSSEYADDTLGLVYYNYRHYNSIDGRWMSRDPIGESECPGLYAMCSDNPVLFEDVLGLSINVVPEFKPRKSGDKYLTNEFLLTDIGWMYDEYMVLSPLSGKKDWKVKRTTVAYTDVDLYASVVCECDTDKGYWFPKHATIQVKPRIHLREWYVDDNWWNSSVKDELDHVKDILRWASDEGLPLVEHKRKLDEINKRKLDEINKRKLDEKAENELEVISVRKVAESFLGKYRHNQPKDLTKEECQELNWRRLIAELREDLTRVFVETKNKWDSSGKHGVDDYPDELHEKMARARDPNRRRRTVK